VTRFIAEVGPAAMLSNSVQLVASYKWTNYKYRLMCERYLSKPVYIGTQQFDIRIWYRWTNQWS